MTLIVVDDFGEMLTRGFSDILKELKEMGSSIQWVVTSKTVQEQAPFEDLHVE